MIRRQVVVRHRSGFTLLELLVVIMIIVVLATLSVGASMRVIESQREANTQTLLQNVDKALQQAWAKVVADAKSNNDTPSPAVLSMAGGDPRLARIIWIKVRLMEAFPMNYAEVQNPLVYQNYAATGTPYITLGQRKYMPTYQNALGSGASNNAATESAACLLMALSINRGGGAVLNPDSIAANILDTDGDGRKEIVDGWEKPVAFFRFPTPSNLADLQNSSPGASNTSSRGYRNADPVDPDGLLLNAYSNSSTSATAFTALCHPIAYSTSPLRAYYVVPVIASAGVNGKLGLQSNMSISVQDDANDNIYSFFLRMGGTGN